MKTRRVSIDADVDRLVVVSDIHGFIEPLAALDEIIGPDSRQMAIIAGGDYCAGGVDPVETVEWVRRRAGERAVRGNHEDDVCEASDGDHPPYTGAGARQRLSKSQFEYLTSLPDILELSWRGMTLHVMHGHLTRCGKIGMDWRCRPSGLLKFFGTPSVDLTIVGHTHYPFVLRQDSALMANSGSTSQIVLAVKEPDGTVRSQDDEPGFTPVSRMFSSFLSITSADGGLQVKVEHFDYDRQEALRKLTEAKDPNLQWQRTWLTTGVIEMPQ